MIGIFSPLRVSTQTMNWESNFSSINLGTITVRAEILEGSSTVRLLMTGDVEISADNGATARLSEPGGDILVTEYKLTFDGNGSSATGASTIDYTSYESFLNPAVLITHVVSDDDVNVTLYVRARNQAGDLANSGSYSATQTLTVTWSG